MTPDAEDRFRRIERAARRVARGNYALSVKLACYTLRLYGRFSFETIATELEIDRGRRGVLQHINEISCQVCASPTGHMAMLVRTIAETEEEEKAFA